MIKNAKNSTLIEAVVMSFSDKKHLNVVINQSVKLSMTWNGKCYEGRSAGMDFESAGPKVTKSTTGLRG
jgi:hypothetical protein